MMHTVVLCKSEVTGLVTYGFSFLMCPGASIMRFEISALVLDFPAYTRTSSTANKLDPSVPSKGLENGD
jgi:hypothetical protein